MFSDNNWYGHRFILKEFCKIKEDLPIFGSLQHGCHYEGYVNSVKNIGQRTFETIPHFCWDEDTKNILEERGIKNVYSIGSPFLYLINMMNSKIISANEQLKKKGILYFPTHTTTEFDFNFDKQKKIVEKIERNNNGPYTVCLYYHDLKKNIINFYKRKKWNIECCGKRDDNFMLFKIYNLIQRHEKCIFSYYITPLFYSLILKKKTQIILDKILHYFPKNIEKEFYLLHKNKYPSFFNKEIDREEGFKYAKKFLGLESMKNQNELKNLLGWNSFFKKKISIFFAKLIDIKYSKRYRVGKKLKNVYKKKLPKFTLNDHA